MSDPQWTKWQWCRLFSEFLHLFPANYSIHNS